jgi:hypothetical protein
MLRVSPGLRHPSLARLRRRPAGLAPGDAGVAARHGQRGRGGGRVRADRHAAADLPAGAGARGERAAHAAHDHPVRRRRDQARVRCDGGRGSLQPGVLRVAQGGVRVGRGLALPGPSRRSAGVLDAVPAAARRRGAVRTHRQVMREGPGSSRLPGPSGFDDGAGPTPRHRSD